MHEGGGLFSWAHFSTILEPYNYHRKIIGFDTLQFARLKIKKGWKTKNKRAGHSQESLYARYAYL